MARAETTESVAESGAGGSGRGVELPRPLHTWPGLLSTGPGAVHLHHDRLPPLRALCMSYPPLPDRRPLGHDQTRTPQDSPALWPPATPPPSPLCDRRSAAGGPSGSERRATGRHPSRRRAWAACELDARQVARQLRTIGDEFDTAVHRRMHVAPQWQDWGEVCRALLTFITQPLRSLYRLT